MDPSDRISTENIANPFSLLVESSSKQPEPENHGLHCGASSSTNKLKKKQRFSTSANDALHLALANIFHIICDNSFVSSDTNSNQTQQQSLIFIPDFDDFTIETVEDRIGPIIFERLMMDKVKLEESKVQCTFKLKFAVTDLDLTEYRIVYYLYKCFSRLDGYTFPVAISQLKLVMKEAIATQCANYLFRINLYPNSDYKLLNLLDSLNEEYHGSQMVKAFLECISSCIVQKTNSGEEELNLEFLLSQQVYEELTWRVSRYSLDDSNLFKTLEILHTLTSSPELGRAFMILNSPWESINYRTSNTASENREPYSFDLNKMFLGTSRSELEVMSTLLGRILSISCLPRPSNANYEFFVKAKLYDQEYIATANHIVNRLEHLIDALATIFLSMLRQPATYDLVLNWIGLVLYIFKERAKLWNNEIMLGQDAVQSSDGFMINFGNLLLQLCVPFSNSSSSKLLKIDPRYCKAQSFAIDAKSFDVGIFLREVNLETFMVPSPTNDADRLEIPKKFNFITEIFFLTHRSLHLGFRSCHERFLKMFSNIQHLVRMLQESQAGASSDSQALLNQIEIEMTPILSMRTMLSQEKQLELMLKFCIATCGWCINLAMSPNISHAKTKFHSFSLDHSLTSSQSECVSLIPEFVVENILDTIIYIRRFSERTLSIFQSSQDFEPLMTFVLTFMGSPQKMNNPHLRAKIAEILEAFMTKSENSSFSGGLFGYSDPPAYEISKKFFTMHPHIDQLVPTLLHVFVSIEMTGTSVAFEQKFQYRRPMYLVLRHLWYEVGGVHKLKMKELAIQAETEIENPQPPLFLRFINLLINDAIFLLDEALGHMSKLRELQQQKDSDSWAWMTPAQQQEQNRNFGRIGRLARFHNIIGNDTINTLSWLTEEIKTIFSHKVMVDRIAAMCNYFLLHLVGPKKKNFKVKDGAEGYHFKPSDIVHDICCIYVNLGSKANPKWRSFCTAVVNDARSYSDNLLNLAADVLLRTGKASGIMTLHLEELGSSLKMLSIDQAQEDIDPEDVPEEFLDPIMGSIMVEPVKLPSGYILDRSTIARHLLSDQTDPFTRAPLNMEMVERQTQLEESIARFRRNYKRTNKPPLTDN